MSTSEMPISSLLAATFRSVQDAYSSYPLLFIFSTVALAFTVLIVTLVTIVGGDPDSANSPIDEERRIFLPRETDSPISPSVDSISSPLRADSTNWSFAQRSQETKISEANVERLLAAHRDVVGDRLSDGILEGGIYLTSNCHDDLSRAGEREEFEDEEEISSLPPKVRNPQTF
ncbi:hypothetical protein NP233_g1126 [Leucocoprinus birnbaumii]|uniref:Uncharacterized protein n=1 Tax=Leucocoprinus birnbaumii TaxID=56174 RepID=A0AAD5W1M2_9AGAR|nr:hypothetical protein NP233_g1126 [Leucocoprinus birnbaumii]